MTGHIEIAFPEMECDLVERALLPAFGLGKPKRFTRGIM